MPKAPKRHSPRASGRRAEGSKADPEPRATSDTPPIDSPHVHEHPEEEDPERCAIDHSRRLDGLAVALDRVIDLATIWDGLKDGTSEGASSLSEILHDTRRLIRVAVLDLHEAWADLQGRFELAGVESFVDLPPCFLAFNWTGTALDAILTRAGYGASLSCESDGRFIHRYSPPKGPSLDDLMRRMDTGPDGQVTITGPGAESPPEGEIAIDDAELESLRAARALLRSDRLPRPSSVVAAPTREQVFPIGWVEEDCDRAESLLRLGHDWRQAVSESGPDSEVSRRAHDAFEESGDYFLTFLHRYFALPRVDPASPFAGEAERLSAALHGIEAASMFWSASCPFRGRPREETWAALDGFAVAVAELEGAIVAYRSQAPVASDRIEALTPPTLPDTLTPVPAPDPQIVKEKHTEERDKFIYDKCRDGIKYKSIIKLVSENCNWDNIESCQGIKNAGSRYAERHELPTPGPRKAGRPKKNTN